MKSSVMVLLCRLDLRVGATVIQLENLKVLRRYGSQGNRGQGAALTTKDEVGMVTRMNKSQSSNHNRLTHAHLWCCLVNHDVPRSEIEVLI